MKKAIGSIVVCGLICLTACSSAENHPKDSDWAARNATSDEAAFSPLNQINKGNVDRLGLAWSLDLPGEVTLEATPVAVDGTLYFTGSYGKVYAVQGTSGKIIWSHDPQTWKVNPAKLRFLFAANRGVAYDDGRIFSATLDGRLLALDATTGNLIWSVETVAPDSSQTVTGAPRTFQGKVIIGQGGADFGARGYVTAYDQKTGERIWRFHVVPDAEGKNADDPAMELAAKTWVGEAARTGPGGGGPWDSITFDAELNRIYVGTANASPYDPSSREGDNLFTASIVALDADTGRYLWHYQINPRDSWDYDCTQQMTLATLTIDGKQRKVLMQAPKNGFFYVIDRETGKVISAEKIVKATWASHIDLRSGRPVEAQNIRYEASELIVWPSSIGAHSWMSQSYSPQTGLIYIPTMQSGVRYRKGEPIEGGVYFAGLGMKEHNVDQRDGKGALLAWDPVSQKAAWSVQHDTIWNGGVLATAGDLVVQGAADGMLTAYNAQSGEKLWQFDARMGLIAAPMAWATNGKQYISILAGYGGSTTGWGDLMNPGWKYRSPRRLLTFALDSKAALPDTPARTMKVEAVNDPTIEIDPVDVKSGADNFLACAGCHGVNLIATGGPGPDLRESAIAMDPKAFRSVVRDGALLQNGMPKFDNLSETQLRQFYAYIRAGAREELARQR